jgi:hypothetical protein
MFILPFPVILIIHVLAAKIFAYLFKNLDSWTQAT